MPSAVEIDPIVGLVRRGENERALRELLTDTSGRFKRFVGACLASSGVAAALLVMDSGSETTVQPLGETSARIEQLAVVPDTAPAAEIIPDCSPAGRAVAAYVGREATTAFQAACDPTGFAAQAISSNL